MSLHAPSTSSHKRFQVHVVVWETLSLCKSRRELGCVQGEDVGGGGGRGGDGTVPAATDQSSLSEKSLIL